MADIKNTNETPVKKTTAKKTPAKKPAAKKAPAKKKTAPKADTKTTAIAVAKPQPDIQSVLSLFSDLDISALNTAIEELGKRNNKLSGKEKKYGLEVVNQWERSVIAELNDERSKVTTFIGYMKNFSSNYRYLIDNPDYIEPTRQCIILAGLEDKLDDLKAALDEVAFAEEEVNIIRKNGAEVNESLTELERLEAQHAMEKDLLLKNNALSKARRNLNRIVSEFSIKLNSNPDVKDVLSKLTSFTRTLTKNTTEATRKANAAKLAISIDDPDLRSKLNALISVSLK